VSGVSPGQTLVFIRERNNPHDGNAIAAYSESGLMLGHVNRSDAAYLAPILDRGSHAIARVEEISDKPARLRVTVQIEADDLPPRPTVAAPSVPAPTATKSAADAKDEGIPLCFWILLAITIFWFLSRK
jgi:hypothetical protein